MEACAVFCATPLPSVAMLDVSTPTFGCSCILDLFVGVVVFYFPTTCGLPLGESAACRWAARVVLLQQRLLTQRAPSLRAELLTLHALNLKRFSGTDMHVKHRLDAELWSQVRSPQTDSHLLQAALVYALLSTVAV